MTNAHDGKILTALPQEKKMTAIETQKMLEVAIGSLKANHDELSSLCEILYSEGFGGREDEIETEEQAFDLATERLAWFRDQRREGLR